jgi:rhodanese-related sulfurtransferase
MKFLLLRIGFFIGLCSTLPGCNLFTNKAVPEASHRSLLKVVNVLDAALYNDAHIKGSINIPMAKVKETVKSWDKKQPVVIYCANYTCSASGQIAKELTNLGFTDAFAYEGGTAEWYQLQKNDSSYALEGPAQQGYLQLKVPQPQEHLEGVKTITAQKLKEKMIEAHLI